MIAVPSCVFGSTNWKSYMQFYFDDLGSEVVDLRLSLIIECVVEDESEWWASDQPLY